MTQAKMYSIFLVLVGFVGVFAQENLTVNTTGGPIIGQIATVTNSDRTFVTFYGVPYAGNVDGENRFKAPPPALPFPNVFHAHNPDIICAQPSPTGMIGDENCLSLNVLTKNITGSRPVMVVLMGEQYTTGNYSNLNFERFVDTEDILVVTLNYRLSVFGFLCLGVEDAPGNAGLKDVIAGLRWIRDNIGGFGGNSSNVMLVGHGSAAAMVDLVTLSPLGSGLVHKAIAQSGSSLAPWAVSHNPVESAKAFGEKLDIVNVDNQELAIRIRNANVDVLYGALDSFETAFNNSILFSPCVENANLAEEAFITRDPLSIIQSGEYAQIPIIYGYTNREGTIRAHEAVNGNWLIRMQENFDNFLPVDLSLEVDNGTDIIRGIREFYFAENQISIQTIQDYIDYHGDVITLVSTIRTVIERSQTSRAAVRLYEFAFLGNWGRPWPFPTVPLTGAPHGNELVYLFGNGLVFEGGPLESQVRDSLNRRWAAFARTDIPVAVGSPGNIEWLPATTFAVRQLEYVEVTEIAIIENGRENPHQQRMAFWNNLYNQYYVAPQPVSSGQIILSYAALIFVCLLSVKLI